MLVGFPADVEQSHTQSHGRTLSVNHDHVDSIADGLELDDSRVRDPSEKVEQRVDVRSILRGCVPIHQPMAGRGGFEVYTSRRISARGGGRIVTPPRLVRCCLSRLTR
jgi:hypothetical protein